mmetsp:Transcript_101875/g.269006  ORF Transcript_101875/g.269006 Transcript_101875/m.269006 type:complete len:263 (-) Transcript_101875:40-828(-)
MRAHVLLLSELPLRLLERLALFRVLLEIRLELLRIEGLQLQLARPVFLDSPLREPPRHVLDAVSKPLGVCQLHGQRPQGAGAAGRVLRPQDALEQRVLLWGRQREGGAAGAAAGGSPHPVDVVPAGGGDVRVDHGAHALQVHTPGDGVLLVRLSPPAPPALPLGGGVRPLHLHSGCRRIRCSLPIVRLLGLLGLPGLLCRGLRLRGVGVGVYVGLLLPLEFPFLLGRLVGRVLLGLGLGLGLGGGHRCRAGTTVAACKLRRG